MVKFPVYYKGMIDAIMNENVVLLIEDDASNLALKYIPTEHCTKIQQSTLIGQEWHWIVGEPRFVRHSWQNK